MINNSDTHYRPNWTLLSAITNKEFTLYYRIKYGLDTYKNKTSFQCSILFIIAHRNIQNLIVTNPEYLGNVCYWTNSAFHMSIKEKVKGLSIESSLRWLQVLSPVHTSDITKWTTWGQYVILENCPKKIRALIGSKQCFHNSIEAQN